MPSPECSIHTINFDSIYFYDKVIILKCDDHKIINLNSCKSSSVY